MPALSPARAAAPALLLLLLLLLLQAAPASSSAPGPGTWSLHLLDLARFPLAQCLDGSPGAFYISPGSGAMATTFVFHMQGGGWCTSIEDCVSRATKPVYAGEPSIGSSKDWAAGPCTPTTLSSTPPCTADGGSGGLLSLDAAVNPLMSGSTRVWLGYCSGDSFSGDVDAPYKYNATFSLYFRGRRILDAIVATLQDDAFGLVAAEAVIVSGCSAGGNAAFLQADHVAELVHARNASTRVVGAPGAGFFLDTLSYGGVNNAEPLYSFIYKTMNLGTSVRAQCVADVAPRDPSVCFIPPVALKYVEVPLFVSNSLTDAAQQSWIMALPCNPASGNCNASELAYVDDFHDRMVAALEPVLTSNGRHGAWLVSCSVHMVQDVDGAWGNITVIDSITGESVTQRDAFSNWYTQKAGAAMTGVDVAWTKGTGAHGGNPACEAYGPVPSSPGGG